LGSDPNLKANDSTSAIIHASDKLGTEYLRLLLNHGGNVNIVADIDEPQHLRTPIMAASFKSLENVKLLVDAGANANYTYRRKKSEEGGEVIQSALIYAFNGKRIDVVKYLIMDVKVDYDYPFNITIDGRPSYILRDLRDLVFPLDSDEYKTKWRLLIF